MPWVLATNVFWVVFSATFLIKRAHEKPVWVVFLWCLAMFLNMLSAVVGAVVWLQA